MKVDIERLQDLKDKLTQMERQMGELLANVTRDVTRTAANTSSKYHDHHGVTSCCESVLDTAKRISRLNDKISDMLKRSEKGLEWALDTYVSTERKQTAEIDQFTAWLKELYTNLVNSDAANDLNKWLDNAANAAERLWDNLWASITVGDETSTGWGTPNNGLGTVSAAQTCLAASTAIQGAKMPDYYYDCVPCHPMPDLINQGSGNPDSFKPVPCHSNIAPPESGWDKFKSIFEIEAGYGAGLGASVKILNVVNAEAGGYVDRINFKYEDGKGSLGSKVSAGLNVEALKVIKGLKVGADYEVTNDMINSQYYDPLVGINSDPNSEKEWSYGLQAGNQSIIGANSDGNTDYKLAIGVSAAVGIAGQAEVRVNLTHVKVWWDYLNAQ